MGDNENEDMGFQQHRGVSSGVNTVVPLYENVGGMTVSSVSMFKASNVGGTDTTFFGNGWDPLVSLSEGGNFGSPSMVPHSGFANSSYLNSIAHLPHYPSSDGNLVEMVPNLSRSLFNVNMNSEGGQQMEISDESNELLKDHDEKKQKNSSNVRGGKQTTNDTSESGEAPKENYVHMRARRGQATNSHSLAERVRREKISERMKMLQELVPGCNKITGKAIMLDEIINYVQSLQQQVEFLSMKLATVNPELSVDFEQVLSKDILHSRGGNTPVISSGSGTNTSYSYPHGILPHPQFQNPMPQTVWNNQIQGFLQMGYDTDSAADNQGLDGLSKQNT